MTTLLEKHQNARQAIFDHVGYREDWRILPIDDATEFYWELDGEGPGEVRFAESAEDLSCEFDECDIYSNQIYTQRHLPKWVYRGADYTMIVVDTHCDGNQLLQIFDNSKEIK